MTRITGMRGDFLGEAPLAWEDLEIGRQLDLTLRQRKNVKRGSVAGTIKLLVGEPVIDVVVDEQEQAVDTSVAAITSAQTMVDTFVEKEVKNLHR